MFETEGMSKSIADKNIHFILPLICCVETPSFIFYGTPIVYSGQKNDQILKNYNIKNDVRYLPTDMFLLN